MTANAPHTSREIQALRARHAHLEKRAARCYAALRDSEGRSPSLGRELDAVSATLAQVRAELARLTDDPRGTRRAATRR